jgi:hypothetical protein
VKLESEEAENEVAETVGNFVQSMPAFIRLGVDLIVVTLGLPPTHRLLNVHLKNAPLIESVRKLVIGVAYLRLVDQKERKLYSNLVDG